jgi:hypothetical protein
MQKENGSGSEGFVPVRYSRAIVAHRREHKRRVSEFYSKTLSRGEENSAYETNMAYALGEAAAKVEQDLLANLFNGGFEAQTPGDKLRDAVAKARSSGSEASC